MREDLTDITLVLDRSGSMSRIKDDTIGGFNEFLEDQQKVEGEATFSLVQFDDEYEPVHNALPIKDVPKLSAKTFVPRGMTRLLDAIGRTIVMTGQRLDQLVENDKPGRVIFVIFTDGQENDSREYGGPEGKAKVMNMIKHQTDKYKWEFVFLGAKQDAIGVGGSIGIKASNAMRFGHTGGGIKKAFASASKNLTGYRGMSVDKAAYAFAAVDRDEQKEEIEAEN